MDPRKEPRRRSKVEGDSKRRPFSRQSRPSGFRNRSTTKTARDCRKRSVAGVFCANGRAKTFRIVERLPSEVRSKRGGVRFTRKSTISERAPTKSERGTSSRIVRRGTAISRREAIRWRSWRPKRARPSRRRWPLRY